MKCLETLLMLFFVTYKRLKSMILLFTKYSLTGSDLKLHESKIMYS